MFIYFPSIWKMGQKFPSNSTAYVQVKVRQKKGKNIRKSQIKEYFATGTPLS